MYSWISKLVLESGWMRIKVFRSGVKSICWYLSSAAKLSKLVKLEMWKQVDNPRVCSCTQSVLARPQWLCESSVWEPYIQVCSTVVSQTLTACTMWGSWLCTRDSSWGSWHWQGPGLWGRGWTASWSSITSASPLKSGLYPGIKVLESKYKCYFCTA